jgi:lipopolysaccharide/colanic/teichoic acid biosynthesis glycosyltransferase
MNHSLPQLDTVGVSREILFVGFQTSIEAHIFDFPYNNQSYTYSEIQDSGQAFRWLEEKVSRLETYQLPYAILCDLQWLLADGFCLAHQVAAHPDLRYVPLIVMTDKRRAIEKSELVGHGVDDCYTVPVPWALLEARLGFLNQYKSKLLELAREARQDNWSKKMPLAKRAFDILAVMMVMPFLLPLCLVVALAVYLESKGPVIYRSKRVGTNYRVFTFLKFRSMYQDADKRLQEIQHLNQYQDGALFVKFARDPRVTRVGRIIRKYSIDELPQLINILRGDMSIVGNRPLPLYEAEMLTREEYCARFLAPAGLTGLWQVTKRGTSDMSAEERIALDLAYAKQPYSILTDLKIVFKTLTAFVQKEDV